MAVPHSEIPRSVLAVGRPKLVEGSPTITKLEFPPAYEQYFQVPIIESAIALQPGFRDRAAHYDATGTFPKENFAELTKAGFMGLTIPAEYGGLGANHVTAVDSLRRIAQADASTALVLNMHRVSTEVIGAVGTEEQKNFYLGEEVMGKGAFISAATSEPGQGFRDRFSIQTTFHKTEGGYKVKGKKWFCSGSEYASYFMVAGRDAETNEVMFALVPKSEEIKVGNDWNTAGMRATGSHSVNFEDAFVSDFAVLGAQGDTSAGKPNDVLASGRFTHFPEGYAAVYLGIGEAALGEILPKVEKQVKGKPQEHFVYDKRVHAIGEMGTEAYISRLALYDAALQLDNLGRHNFTSPEFAERRVSTFTAVTRAKNVCTRTTDMITEKVKSLAGGSFAAMGNPIQRHIRDAETGEVMPPHYDRGLFFIGMVELGQPPPPLLHLE